MNGQTWIEKMEYQIAEATKWSVTPAMLEEKDMAYLLYLTDCLMINSFIEEKWQKEQERQAKMKQKRNSLF